MSAQKPTEPARHESLAAALAAFQAELPSVGKDNTATVPTKTGGSYTYKFADLSDVSRAVLPAMALHGLSFSSKPTLTDNGHFVLAYVLRHDSGEEDAGTYPLPTGGTPQSVGSALTYARRYVLSAMSGVAPDEDDDGQAAQHASYDRPPARRDEPAREEPAELSPVDTARIRLFELVEHAGWDVVEVRKKFAAQYKYPLREASDPNVVTAFGKLLPSLMEQAAVEPESASASNGAAQ